MRLKIFTGVLVALLLSGIIGYAVALVSRPNLGVVYGLLLFLVVSYLVYLYDASQKKGLSLHRDLELMVVPYCSEVALLILSGLFGGAINWVLPVTNQVIESWTRGWVHLPLIIWLTFNLLVWWFAHPREQEKSGYSTQPF